MLFSREVQPIMGLLRQSAGQTASASPYSPVLRSSSSRIMFLVFSFVGVLMIFMYISIPWLGLVFGRG